MAGQWVPPVVVAQVVGGLARISHGLGSLALQGLDGQLCGGELARWPKHFGRLGPPASARHPGANGFVGYLYFSPESRVGGLLHGFTHDAGEAQFSQRDVFDALGERP